MHNQTKLAGSSEFLITHHANANREHDALIITFAGQPGQMSETGFGTQFCLSQKYDTIYVSQKYETHFQGLDIETFRQAVEPYLTGRRVVCYGSSLGAYAALYYGGSINAEILAGAPMLPSWPSLGNPRYKDFKLTHIPMEDTPRTSHAPLILFDPLVEKDVKFLNETARLAYPDANYLEFPHAGHTVFATMDQAKMLTKNVLNFFATGVLPEIVLPTESFPPWHISMGNQLFAKKEFEEAARHGLAAFENALPNSPAIQNSISLSVRALAASGNAERLKTFVESDLLPEQRTKFIKGIPALAALTKRVLGIEYD